MSAEPFQAPSDGRFPTGDPYRGAEIAAALRDVHDASVAFLAEMSDEEFVEPQGAFWSPSQHVRHLRRSCQPVATALAAPKVALGLRFGRPSAPSSDLAGVVDRYHQALAAGGNADGTDFDAPSIEIEDAVDRWRVELVAGWTDAVTDVARRAEGWSESALDRYQLPHPLLGNMTVREILLFTVYHNAHHVRRVAERGRSA